MALKNFTRSSLIQYGKKRAKSGAGSVPLAIDFSYLRTIMTHAAAIHGICVDTECIRLTRTALSSLGLIGKSDEQITERGYSVADVSRRLDVSTHSLYESDYQNHGK